MKMIFRTPNGKKILNVANYIKIFLANNGHQQVKIHIGTDSQNSKKNTQYSLVIALRYGEHRGAHYIHHTLTMPKITDIYQRLWKEVEYSIELSEHLKENNILVNFIELDFNQRKGLKSHMVLAAGTGYVTGLGYKVLTKPDELVAVKAADHVLRL